MSRVASTVLLLVLALAACYPVLNNRFMGDDFIWLYDASQVRSPADLFAVHDVAFAPYDGVRLNPTTNLYFAIGWPLFHLWPGGYHLFALALYVLTAALLVAWQRELGLPRPAAVAGGAFFVLYPLHVEPVAWPSAIGEVLVGLFSIASLLAFVRWRRSGAMWSLAASMLALLAAVLAKESALVLPLVILLADLLLVRADFRLRRHVLPWTLALVVAVWKSSVLAAARADIGIHPLQLGFTDVVRGWFDYMVGSLIGFDAVRRIGSPPVLAGLVVAASCAAVAWLALARRWKLAFHGAWLLVAVQPYVWWVPGQALENRYSWQASLPLACLFACAAAWGLSRLGRRAWLPIVAVLAAMAVSTRQHALALQFRDNTEAVVASLTSALDGVTADDTIYVYNRLDKENAGARGVVLMGNVPPGQVHNWYEALQRQQLGPHDRFVFWDDIACRYFGLTESVKPAHAVLQGRLDPRRGLPRAQSIPTFEWRFDRPEGRAQWTEMVPNLSWDGALVRTPGMGGVLCSPALILSPFAVDMVWLEYVQREGDGDPMVGWGTDADGGIAGMRVISPTQLTKGRSEVRSAVFRLPSRHTFWTGGRIRRLFLVPSSEAGVVELRVLQIHTFGTLR